MLKITFIPFEIEYLSTILAAFMKKSGSSFKGNCGKMYLKLQGSVKLLRC